MDKKWQEHDRLLGRMVLSPMYICWVPPLPSPLCLCAAVRIAVV
jgi:membrane protein YqaA with SNARE-associated domain